MLTCPGSPEHTESATPWPSTSGDLHRLSGDLLQGQSSVYDPHIDELLLAVQDTRSDAYISNDASNDPNGLHDLDWESFYTGGHGRQLS